MVVVVNVAPSGGTADWSQAAALPPEGWRALRPRTAPGAGSTQPEKGRGGEEGGGKGQPPTPGEYTHRILKPSAPAEPTQGGRGRQGREGEAGTCPPGSRQEYVASCCPSRQPPGERRPVAESTCPPLAAAGSTSPSPCRHVPSWQQPGVRRQMQPSRVRHVPSWQPPGVRRQKWHVPSRQMPGVRRQCSPATANLPCAC